MPRGRARKHKAARKRRAQRSQRPGNWEELPDEEILQMRVRDLGVQIPGSNLEPLVQRVYEELDAKGVRFHPPCYLADEWLCPDKDPIIGIPFCLAHPRLKSIELRLMLEVEGEDEKTCLKLLRHECGHALNYAYQLYKRTRWRELFGPFSTRYSDSYSYQPYSRRFVIHLKDNYAQAHPDEDFAETFAVWLRPDSRWQEKYRGWPVMKKLMYVDRVMRHLGEKPSMVKAPQNPPWSASRMTSTLAAHYERKRRALGSEFQGFYDDSLKELFSVKSPTDSRMKASKLLRLHRRRMIDSLSRWTGHRKYDMHQLVNRCISRCDVLDLYASTDDTENMIAVTALLTAIASNTLRIVPKGQP
ncbi:MAG: putative zinc-binding metallopeptidase [Candidatus Eiseniibacteriota bacterium]|nr:MAG: putative zinc-binding metallopeptidase [Candidatus Eisenbacteria bacterium]